MDRNVDEKDQYRFNWRARHTTAIVGDVLYCWGGSREGLDVLHCDSAIKRQCTSAVDAFNLLSGVWSSKATRGTPPPLGIRGVSCTTINNNIYYFGGYCGHDSCYHNSLNCLDTLTLQWKELQPTGDNSVSKRGYGGMIAMGSEGEPQQLLVIGGIAPISTITQYHHQFKYHKIPYRDNRLSTNEQNIYNLSSGQWIVPSVSGQCCSPTTHFRIERISHNKGIMYGGIVTDGDRDETTNSIYLFQLSKYTINWECLKQGSVVPNDGLWPEGRDHHASTIINGVCTSPTLVVIGGTDSDDELVNECLLLDTNQYNWIKISLPDSVTGRYHHTVSSFVVDPNHVFLIIVGGDVRSEKEDVEGAMNWIDTAVTDPNITMVVELVFNDGQWSVGPVLDSFNIPLLYEQILKERRKELIGMNEYMTDKEKELQVINESLRHDLQVSRINYQSLQEALLEIELEKSMLETQLLETKTLLTKRKRGQEDSPHSDNSKKLKTDEEESVEEKQIITEDNEKLRGATVKQVEEYLQKKQIIIDELKSKLFEKDAQISKLIKEKSEKEAQAEKHLREKENKLDFLSDVQVAEKKLFLIQGDKPQLMNWEKYGLRIGVQEGSLLSSETVEAAVVALVGGQFQFPPNTVLVSAVYAVSLSEPLLKRLKLEIQHCVDLTRLPDLAQYLKFAIAPVSTPSLPYQFSIVEGGEFCSNSGYGSIQRKEFCLVCILGEEWTNGGGNGIPSVNGDTEEGEEEEEQLQQEENEEEDEFEEIQHELQEKKDEEGAEDKGDDDDDSSSDSTGVNNKTNSIPEASGAAKEPINEEKELKDNEEKEQSSSESIPHDKDKVQPTGLKEAIRYAGLVYYEEDGVEDLVTVTAVKKLNTLLEFIKKEYPQAKRKPHFNFCIASSDGFIELNLNAPQDEQFTGWSIKPHITPCKLFQRDIHNFGDKDYPLPPFCLISVYSSPDAVPTLHYSVPVEGVVDPVTINIQISQRRGTAHPIAAAPSSSGNDETNPVPTKRRREGGFDIKTAKQKIKKVMIENHTDFAGLLQFSLDDVANKLFEVHMIPPKVQQSPTYDAISTCFLSMMSLLDSKSDLEKHCVKYLEALSSVGGPIEFAANLLREKWTAALEGALQFEQSVKRVRTNDAV